jgi:hypothetical protein
MQHRQSVRFGHAKNMIGGNEPARPDSVLNHNGRIPGNIFRQVTREEARPDINGSPGRKSGNDIDGFPGVKRLLRGDKNLREKTANQRESERRTNHYQSISKNSHQLALLFSGRSGIK